MLRSCDYCCDWATMPWEATEDDDRDLCIEAGQATLRWSVSWRSSCSRWPPPGACPTTRGRSSIARTRSAASHGVAALKEHDTLTRKAEEWAQHMAVHRPPRALEPQLEPRHAPVAGARRERRLLVAHQRHAQDDPQHVRQLLRATAPTCVNSSYTHMGVGRGQGQPRQGLGRRGLRDRSDPRVATRGACQTPAMAGRRPNILFIVSDQERERSWLPASVRLPWRERLLAEGVELANHWTHSAPCSPSRATMMTGRYLPGHLVYDNTVFPWHHSLDPAIPTVGSQLGGQGYRSSYIGKWHLTGGPTPPMDLYGYADWDGNDQHFMGWAGTGVHFDPVIADSAERWLDANGGQADPWFLTVALVNPHDVMWFPMDQPGVPGGASRRAGGHRGAARGVQVEGRPGGAAVHARLRRRRRRAAGELRRRPPHQAGLPPAVALGPAALAGRLPPTRRPGAVAAAARLLREAPRAGRREPRQGARPPSSAAAPGTTP